MSDRSPLPRTIRGGRPVFFDDPAIDKVLAMLLNLASDVWAQRERLAAVESIARARGLLQPGEVDAFRFAEDEMRKLDALRREFIDGLFRVLKVEAEKFGPLKPRVPSAGATALPERRQQRKAPARKAAPRPAKAKAKVRATARNSAAKPRRKAAGARRPRR